MQKPAVSRLIAPVSGRVLRVLTENEQVVLPGTPLLEIGDPGKSRDRRRPAVPRCGARTPKGPKP